MEQQMNGHQKQKEQSREMIENALFALMEEKDFTQITVSELAARADVARRTFYRLYESREAVIGAYLDKICRSYQAGHAALRNYDIAQIAQEYFTFWYQHRPFLLLLAKNGLDELLYCKIRSNSLQVIEKRMAEPQMQNFPDLIYFADYSAGGFISLLRRWVDGGMQEGPEQYAEKVSAALLMFLRSAPTPGDLPVNTP